MYLEGVVKDVNSIRYMTAEEMEQRGVRVFTNTEITKVIPDKHEVEVLDHVSGETRTEAYDKLILSPGANPFILASIIFCVGGKSNPIFCQHFLLVFKSKRDYRLVRFSLLKPT